jgi:hypothetical protein
MPPNPLRIAQTTSEVKKQHKQNGPRLPERQQKQLERGHELDIRAARLRESEERRKAAKKKRNEREEKEKAARRQMGVGLATQLIGYSHTQAQLKNGMEAFLGVKKRREEEEEKKQRRQDMELARKLEAIAQQVEKEPWDNDDDDDDDDDDDITNDNNALDLPQLPEPNRILQEHYVDDDLDDDTLLEIHDLIMPDPIEEPPINPQPTSLPSLPPLPPVTAPPSGPSPTKDNADFARLHGPINKAIECILDKLPEPLVELLSQDISLKLPDWNPAPGLLHKLNPLGLPPHRLRIKVGSIVTVLRDLNTSSQLSKSQHLRILRAENERLECLVLDGQLEGTKALLTRVKFPANYRNDLSYPFQRTQFPIRVATDFTPASVPRDISQLGFKLPSMPNRVRCSNLSKKSVFAVPKIKPQNNKNPDFKLPGLPASKAAISNISRPLSICQPVDLTVPPPTDGWDDFLESGTQIARELSAEVATSPPLSHPITTSITTSSIAESLPPLSTQDFDFSMDDLEDILLPPVAANLPTTEVNENLEKTGLVIHPAESSMSRLLPTHGPQIPTRSISSSRQSDPAKGSTFPPKSKPQPQPQPQPQQSKRIGAPSTFATLTPSQRPPSVSDRPGLKRKAFATPTKSQQPSIKRPCSQAVAPKPLTVHHTPSIFGDFGISTQEASSFFVDDEDLWLGSPPIAV